MNSARLVKTEVEPRALGEKTVASHQKEKEKVRKFGCTGGESDDCG